MYGRQIVQDDALGFDSSAPSSVDSGKDAKIPRNAAYSYLIQHAPKTAQLACIASKQIVDYEPYRKDLDKLVRNDNYSAILILTFTGASSDISEKLSFFSANDMNAASGISVKLDVPMKEVTSVSAQRGVNYASPPNASIAKISTGTSVSYAPVYQGLINTNYVEYAKDTISDSLGMKKVFQHLTLLTHMVNGSFLVRPQVDIYHKYSSCSIFDDAYEKKLAQICLELQKICEDNNITLGKDNRSQKSYGDFLVKMFDKVVNSKGTMKPYQNLLVIYNSIFRTKNYAGKTYMSGTSALRPGVHTVKVDSVDENGQKSQSSTIQYNSIPLNGIALPKAMVDAASVSEPAELVLSDSRKWGGTNNQEYNVGQRDYLLGAWIGADAGDMVRLASNLSMFRETDFLFTGNSVDLVNLCRGLAYKDNCDIAEDIIKEPNTYNIMTDESNVRNNNAFIYVNDTDEFVFARHTTIKVKVLLGVIGSVPKGYVNFVFNDKTKGSKATEKARQALKTLTMLGSNEKFISRMAANTTNITSLLQYNEGKDEKDKIWAVVGVELHNLVLWISKGVAVNTNYSSTHITIDSQRDAASYFKASVYVNQFRMFNAFWNVPFRAFARKYNITLPHCRLSAEISFATVASMISADGLDADLANVYDMSQLVAMSKGMGYDGGMGRVEEEDPGDDSWVGDLYEENFNDENCFLGKVGPKGNGNNNAK